MKYAAFIFAVTFIWACSSNSDTSRQQAEIDSLKAEIQLLKEHAYQPGLGEFMASVQMHHAKLWFAGKARNWELAGFEIKEIKENLEGSEKLTSRKEVAGIPTVYPALDSISAAIKATDAVAFDRNYRLLTDKCNSCHLDQEFGYNIIQVPTSPPMSNQVFGLGKER